MSTLRLPVRSLATAFLWFDIVTEVPLATKEAAVTWTCALLLLLPENRERLNSGIAAHSSISFFLTQLSNSSRRNAHPPTHVVSSVPFTLSAASPFSGKPAGWCHSIEWILDWFLIDKYPWRYCHSLWKANSSYYYYYYIMLLISIVRLASQI